MDIMLVEAINLGKLEKDLSKIFNEKIINLILMTSETKNKDELYQIIEDWKQSIIKIINQRQIERRVEIVRTAGSLSRFDGNVNEVLELAENKTLNQNLSFVNRVISMGHSSIIEHDYCVFLLKDVSPIIEQTIIEERFSSFTIKSRREVDFSKVGFYVPDFYDNTGKIIENNEQVKKEYTKYMNLLFQEYKKLLDLGISVEDARYILPYSYHSNIIMGIDAHTLKDMIIKFTKTKYSNIQEIKEFGEKLYEIARNKIPYIIKEIDNYPYDKKDSVDEYLKDKISVSSYKILDKPKLLNYSKNIDDTILISALMRRYQIDYQTAKITYQQTLKEYPEFKKKLMRNIILEGDKLEISQVNFQFQIPISFAVLTHLTRHRTHDIIVPDFVPIVDLTQYKTPPTIEQKCNLEYKKIFEENKKMYEHFKFDYNIREEDLIYFTLSGNMVNIITNMNGKTLEHILRLRECNKTQWETRKIAHNLHSEVANIDSAEIFASLLGPTCETQRICKEGKESCGKILKLKKEI